MKDISWAEMTWLNEPPRSTVEDGALIVETGLETDFWRTTSYGFINDNGHLLGLPLPPDAAIEVANLIAPEHLQLMTEDPGALVDQVRHAGAVFCGALSPASIGDYVAGPSHVLPTHGTARFAGALTVADFVKDLHVVTVDRAGFEAVADHVEVLAAAEGFDAHAQSIRIRR